MYNSQARTETFLSSVQLFPSCVDTVLVFENHIYHKQCQSLCHWAELLKKTHLNIHAMKRKVRFYSHTFGTLPLHKRAMSTFFPPSRLFCTWTMESFFPQVMKILAKCSLQNISAVWAGMMPWTYKKKETASRAISHHLLLWRVKVILQISQNFYLLKTLPLQALDNYKHPPLLCPCC